MKEKTSLAVGGQAVLEGVMFRLQNKATLAVRKPDGTIYVEKKNLGSKGKKTLSSWPIIRGSLNLIDALSVGVEMLTKSANLSEGEEGENLSKREIFFAVFFAVITAIGLFFVLPTLITGLLEKITPQTLGFKNLIEGLIRLSIFLIYIFLVSKVKEIHRVFQYHGAEHMVVHCHEQGEELTVENVMKYSPLHKRCGTSFLLIVMVISILVFSLLPWMALLPRLLLRILLIPLIAGLAYEVTRLAGKYNSPVLNIIIYPGLWLQRLTTKTPNPSQVEVAIAAITALLEDDSVIDREKPNLYNIDEIANEAEV
ncbi:Uncharacterized conserved protein YqhQ [Anaerobranca californiensis DSM 14826]|jgi:uncharacterized protein YqhQ|uniref:Uncharacterized conserved protein YqhQ n=1 Tax=Anaerobranca californiensis DSM 14826 TaxID=1120989 RepID=A0A1M6M8Z7_9FIRM|nr:DUF1385 domain-containing protein [Anaerobranca californiensis]SHJ79840.1 Uncharacterized conserved protein YqhQ [Anaerobranca californiensis DSM 14826]